MTKALGDLLDWVMGLLGRLNPLPLLRGHLKTLTLRSTSVFLPDRVARVLIFGIPVALAALAGWRGFKIASPDSILAGLSLLVAGLLAVFAQIAAWRDRLTERAFLAEHSEDSDRESLDEAATTVLVASAASVLGVISIVIGQSVTHDKHGSLTGFWCAIVVFLGTYVALLFLAVVFRLYDIYLYVNKVNGRISGRVRLPRDRSRAPECDDRAVRTPPPIDRTSVR